MRVPCASDLALPLLAAAATLAATAQAGPPAPSIPAALRGDRAAAPPPGAGADRPATAPARRRRPGPPRPGRPGRRRRPLPGASLPAGGVRPPRDPRRASGGRATRSASRPRSTARSPATPTWSPCATATSPRPRRSRSPGGSRPRSTRPSGSTPADHPDPARHLRQPGDGRHRRPPHRAVLPHGQGLLLHLVPPADRAGAPDHAPLRHRPGRADASSSGPWSRPSCSRWCRPTASSRRPPTAARSSGWPATWPTSTTGSSRRCTRGLEANQVAPADVALAEVENQATRQQVEVAQQDYANALTDLRNQIGIPETAGTAEPLGEFVLPRNIPDARRAGADPDGACRAGPRSTPPAPRSPAPRPPSGWPGGTASRPRRRPALPDRRGRHPVHRPGLHHARSRS